MSDKIIKPKHKAIESYHEALQRYSRRENTYESALRVAFLNLLSFNRQEYLQALDRFYIAMGLIPKSGDRMY